MHELRIPGWREIVGGLVPFYRQQVWYLFVLSLAMGAIAVVPLALVLFAFAILTFVLSTSELGGAGSVVNVLLGSAGIASVVWMVATFAATQIAMVRASFDGNAVPLMRRIRESYDARMVANMVGVWILYGLLLIVGFVFFVVPGVYLAVRGSYIPFALVAERLGAIDAIKRSWALTKGYWWVTALRYSWLVLAFGAGSAVIALLAAAPGMSVVSGMLDAAWQALVVAPVAVLFGRRMYELVRERKAQDPASFHALTGNEKGQVALLVALFLALGSVQSLASSARVQKPLQVDVNQLLKTSN